MRSMILYAFILQDRWMRIFNFLLKYIHGFKDFFYSQLFSYFRNDRVNSGLCRRCRFCCCCCPPVASIIVDGFAPVALPALALLPQIVELSSFRGSASTLVLRLMWVYDAFAQSFFLDTCMPGVRVWVLKRVFIVMFWKQESSKTELSCNRVLFEID